MSRLFINFINIIIFSIFFVSCISTTTKNIEGHYLLVDGNSNKLESMDIEKVNENYYRFNVYRTSGVLEWENLVLKVESNQSKVVWSDKWIPVEIQFNGKKVEITCGNGAFGKYIFERQND